MLGRLWARRPGATRGESECRGPARDPVHDGLGAGCQLHVRQAYWRSEEIQGLEKMQGPNMSTVR